MTKDDDDPKTTDKYPIEPPDPDLAEDAVDPENPRPEGHFGRFRSNTWHYIPEELARSISLGPATDGEPGDDWVFTYTPEERDDDEREKVLVRLSPQALHELYIETKDLSPDARQAGHTAECDFCGESVPLEKAVPNKREEPVHKRCYIDAYGGPVWMKDY